MKIEVKFFILIILMGSVNFAAPIDTLKEKITELDKQIAEAEKFLSGPMVTKNNIEVIISNDCGVSLEKFRKKTMTSTQAKCADRKIKEKIDVLKPIDDIIEKNTNDTNAYWVEYRKILNDSRKKLKPEEMVDLLNTSANLHRSELRNSIAKVRSDIHRSDLIKQKQVFEDTLAYAYTTEAIQGTLNSPLLCQAINRCAIEPETYGNFTISEIKKSIGNSAVNSAVKKANKKAQTQTK